MKTYKWILLLTTGIFTVLAILFRDTLLISEYTLIISGFVLFVVLFIFHVYPLFLLLIFVVPLSIEIEIGKGAQLNFPSEGLLLLFSVGLLFVNRSFRASIARYIKLPLTVIIAFDLGIELLTTLSSSDVVVSFKHLFIHLIYVLGFYFTTLFLMSKKRSSHFYLAYLIGLVPVMLLTLYHLSTYNFDLRTVFAVCKPFYTDHTIFGACLAFLIPFLFLFIRKRNPPQSEFKSYLPLLVLFLLLCISEFLTLSRAAIFSVFFTGLVYALILVKARVHQLLIGLLILGSLIYVQKDKLMESFVKTEAVSNDGKIENHFNSVTNLSTDASNLERLNRWVCAIRLFNEKPISGCGPGTYQFEYNRVQTTEYRTYISTSLGNKGNAHSEYLTSFCEKGVFGGLIYLVFVLASCYFGLKNHRKLKDTQLIRVNLGATLGLITYFVHGWFNLFSDQTKMAALLYISLALIVWISNLTKKESIELEKDPLNADKLG